MKMIIPAILQKVKRCHLTSHQGSQNEIAATTKNINAIRDVFFTLILKYTHHPANKKPRYLAEVMTNGEKPAGTCEVQNIPTLRKVLRSIICSILHITILVKFILLLDHMDGYYCILWYFFNTSINRSCGIE